MTDAQMEQKARELVDLAAGDDRELADKLYKLLAAFGSAVREETLRECAAVVIAKPLWNSADQQELAAAIRALAGKER